MFYPDMAAPPPHGQQPPAPPYVPQPAPAYPPPPPVYQHQPPPSYPSASGFDDFSSWMFGGDPGQGTSGYGGRGNVDDEDDGDQQ